MRFIYLGFLLVKEAIFTTEVYLSIEDIPFISVGNEALVTRVFISVRNEFPTTRVLDSENYFQLRTFISRSRQIKILVSLELNYFQLRTFTTKTFIVNENVNLFFIASILLGSIYS